MIFTPTALAGAYLIDPQRSADERGFFARVYCAAQFALHGLATTLSQCSISYNARRGTLRGLHFQAFPHDEEKIIRCTAGAIYDVIVDLRADSATYRHWIGVELSATNHRSLYVPKGFAHGFVTLADGTEVSYMMSTPYVAGAGRGVRWDDPALSIAWPLAPVVIAARDAGYPSLDGPSTGP